MRRIEIGVNAKRKNKVGQKEPLHKKALNTAREYSNFSSIHGISYLGNPDHHVSSKIFWIFVVIAGLGATAIQMASLYRQWNTNPVITTMDTMSLPIEEIDFPAVTICPQGYIQDIMDNVLYHQLEEYIINRTLHGEGRSKRSLAEDELLRVKKTGRLLWNMTSDELDNYTIDFMEDRYPGAYDNPTNIIPLMISDNPEKLIENEAVLRSFEEEECHENSNDGILNTMNKNLNTHGNTICPKGFTVYEDTCLMAEEAVMTYTEAIENCKRFDNAELLHFISYDDVVKLNAKMLLGMVIS